jgi:hypothetical protein
MDANHQHRGHGWHDWALVRLTGKAFSDLHVESAIHILTIIQIKDENVKKLTVTGFKSMEKGSILLAIC